MKSLEEIMLQLAEFGKPRVCKSSNGPGWFCSIEVHVVAAGANLEVRSDWDCSTPFAAAEQCAERLAAALGSSTPALS